MYAYWVCAARETPIFSPEFPFRSISFSQNYQKIRSGASPFYIFGRILPFRSSSSFRSPTFSRSTAGACSGALAHFSLCRGTYLPKFWGVPPPPPGPLVYHPDVFLLLSPYHAPLHYFIHSSSPYIRSSSPVFFFKSSFMSSPSNPSSPLLWFNLCTYGTLSPQKLQSDFQHQ